MQVIFDMQPCSSDGHTADSETVTNGSAQENHCQQRTALQPHVDENEHAATTASNPVADHQAGSSDLLMLPAIDSSVDAVVDCLRRHEVVALPTDTLYGKTGRSHACKRQFRAVP